LKKLEHFWNKPRIASVEMNACTFHRDAKKFDAICDANKTRAEIITGRRRRTMKVLCGILALACVSTAQAGNNAPFPKDDVTGFLAAKLDVTTLPTSIRPKPQASKKTFSDYGYVAQQADGKQNLVEATPNGAQISITILEQNTSAIYACVQASRLTSSGGSVQRVVLLKLKNAGGLLKGRESFKEFSGCPVLGGDPAGTTSYGD
jgi:hypothetical protein